MTKIEWAHPPGYKGVTWNPVTGCYGPWGSAENPKLCPWCYAERTARHWLAGKAGYPEAPDHFRPTFHPDKLDWPGRRKQPHFIFVCSMGELFGPWVPKEWRDAVRAVVEACPQHIFAFLTKWPQRLNLWSPWPLNAWAGASAINWRELSRAVRHLRGLEASIRFISAEPWLSREIAQVLIDLRQKIDWLIVGQQTGRGAWPYNVDSVSLLVHWAMWANVPIFMKNLDDPPWPYTLRREWPMDALEALPDET